MRIGICDDEKVHNDLLVKYCRNSATYVEENVGQIDIDIYYSGEDLLFAYKGGKHFDLIFLDIKMKQINGFEAASQIRALDNKVIIIFITSLAQYVLKSFEYRPFWYLVKPVSEESFRSVFFRALQEYASLNYHEYTFRTREDGIEKVNISRIVYLESIGRQIRLHTLDEDYYFYAGISKEEIRLSHASFIRVHKSYLVNVQHIKRVNNTNLILQDGETLPVSERRHKAVFDFFTNYLARSTL